MPLKGLGSFQSFIIFPFLSLYPMPLKGLRAFCWLSLKIPKISNPTDYAA
jgi:hypothetical protein